MTPSRFRMRAECCRPGALSPSRLCSCASWPLLARSAPRIAESKPIPVVLGTDSEISIGLPVGTPCTILVDVGSKVVEDFTIGTPPEHGTLMLRGRTGVIYRPKPRFSGDDAFAFSISSRSSADRRKLDHSRARTHRLIIVVRREGGTCKCTRFGISWRLLEERSFTRAARRSGVSQPSLTNAISALEQELGGNVVSP